MPEKPIAHLVPAQFGSDGVIGGAERYALELARAMACKVPTRLVTFGRADAVRRDGSLEIRVIGNPRLVRGQAGNPFKWTLFEHLQGANIVHCHQQHIVASTMAALYCRLTGKKVFVSDLGGGGWDLSAYISTDRLYHGHLHLSQYSRRVFGHERHRRAHVIYGGVDTARFSPDPGRVGERSALFVGRLLPHKGVDYLIEGLPADVPLIVAGPACDEAYLRELKQLAQGKRVTFRHDVGDDELIQLYRSALCVVLPSVYRTRGGKETRVPELLGQTLLEGMACGVPGVATRVASLPEVVADRETGFLVPPNDAIALGDRLVWLHEHPGEAAAMGRRARDRVAAKFSWPAVVERCLNAYEG